MYPVGPVHTSEYQQVVDVWEASVRATHHFLKETDIQYFKPLIQNKYLDGVTLACVRNEGNEIMGFLGTGDSSIEMLFVHPAYFKKGVGMALILHAINECQCITVDVNEQNPEALQFYKHMGFEVIGRSPLDGLGKPYPILHMKLKKAIPGG